MIASSSEMNDMDETSEISLKVGFRMLAEPSIISDVGMVAVLPKKLAKKSLLQEITTFLALVGT